MTLQWVSEAPPEKFLRATRVLRRADVQQALDAWDRTGRDLVAVFFERVGGVFTTVGGPNAVMRQLATLPPGPSTAGIRAALDEMWRQTDTERDVMPALVVWQTGPDTLAMVGFKIDPAAAQRQNGDPS